MSKEAINEAVKEAKKFIQVVEESNQSDDVTAIKYATTALSYELVSLRSCINKIEGGIKMSKVRKVTIQGRVYPKESKQLVELCKKLELSVSEFVGGLISERLKSEDKGDE